MQQPKIHYYNEDYKNYYQRLHTFKLWPPSITQTPEELADAGFYYTGRSDM